MKVSKSRRGRGEGTILPRADGTWYAQISNGVSIKGKRNRITVTGKTKAEARDKLAKKLSSRAEGTLISPDQITVGGFLARWLLAVKGSISGSTWDSYERYVNTHITPAIGGIRLQKLDMLHVETMLGGMVRVTQEKPLEKLSKKRQKYRQVQPPQPSANRTKQYARAILVKALEHAIRGRLVPINVARLVPSPTVRNTKDMTVLNEEQVQQLLAHSPTEEYGDVYGLSVLTGMREGEYLALQWSDIDLKSSPPVIRVQRTQSRVKGKTILEPPKTAAGTRTITLTQTAVDILQRQREKMLRAGYIGRKFVFLDRAGEMLSRTREVRSCLRRMVRFLKLPFLSPHDLRHTHATLLLRAGVNPKVVSERLGHSDVRITLQIYSHVLPDTQADVVDKLNRLLG